MAPNSSDSRRQTVPIFSSCKVKHFFVDSNLYFGILKRLAAVGLLRVRKYYINDSYITD